MATHYSPYTAPGREYDESYGRYSSPTGYIPTPSATPSPRTPHYSSNGYPPAAGTPVRPATRAHFRQMSSGYEAGNFSPRPTASPRFSTYAAGDPNYAYPDDERKAYARHSAHVAAHHPPPPIGAHPVTAHPIPSRYAETPAPEGSRRSGHSRRASAAAHPIQRPQTVRPEAARRAEPASARRAAEASARHQSKKGHSAEPRRATEDDARRHRIPPGYSLKNWDPSEEPILLLGSVFDSNSLGKWIYDWTIYRDGPMSEWAEMAGEMWLLLIQLAGKTRRAMRAVPTVRSAEKREILEDFIRAGERLTDKLRDLLTSCEQPMLEASKNGNKSKLGKLAGVEFTNTMFGEDRMMPQTVKFMKSISLWNLRFDANIEEILREPTK